MSAKVQRRANAALRQEKLAHPRRSVRYQRHQPTSDKKQSTLTQIDFITTPGRDTSLSAANSSLEDDEYEDAGPRPTKKRRTNPPSGKAAQSTLTQNWKHSMNAVSDSDDDDAVISDALDDDKSALNALPAKNISTIGRRETLLRTPPTKSDFVPLARHTQTTQMHTRVKVASGSTTPQRRQILEIPSSQTPQSNKLSRHSVRGEVRFDISPSPIRLRDLTARVSIHLLDHRDSATQSLSGASKTRASPLTRNSTIEDSDSGLDSANIADITAGDEKCDFECSHLRPQTQTQTQYQNTFDPVRSALDRDAARFGQRTQDLDSQLSRTARKPTRHFADDDVIQNSSDDELEPAAIVSLPNTLSASGPHSIPRDSARARTSGSPALDGTAPTFAGLESCKTPPLLRSSHHSPTLLRPSQISTVAPTSPISSSHHREHHRRHNDSTCSVPASFYSSPTHIPTSSPLEYTLQPHLPPAATHPQTLPSSPFPLPALSHLDSPQSIPLAPRNVSLPDTQDDDEMRNPVLFSDPPPPPTPQPVQDSSLESPPRMHVQARNKGW